jgi:hypothetical protein
VNVDRDDLATPVARLLGDGFEVVGWRAESIHTAFNRATGGVYRIRGNASDGAETVPWSLILKVARSSEGPFGGSDDPADPNYWKREFLLYRSGLLDSLPAIRAPRCFGLVERVDSTAWLWLEDVAHRASSVWPPASYREAARSLGGFNGTYLTARPLPSVDSLTRSWLAKTVDGFTPAMDRLAEAPGHPAFGRCWPGGLLERILNLWDERSVLLGELEDLPQTFCHMDAFPRNLLFDRTSGGLVALDWSYAGIAPVGSELVPMVTASVFFYDAEPDQMQRIDDVIVDGYLEGLAAAGARCDSEHVRFAYAASAALRYGLFPMGVLILEPEMRTHLERVLAHPADEIVDRWTRIATFLLDRLDAVGRLDF